MMWRALLAMCSAAFLSDHSQGRRKAFERGVSAPADLKQVAKDAEPEVAKDADLKQVAKDADAEPEAGEDNEVSSGEDHNRQDNTTHTELENDACTKPVQIHYPTGFFGSLQAKTFECDIPCERSTSPSVDGFQNADVLMTFPIASQPPKNDRGAIAVAHTMEHQRLYGGQHMHKYNFTATAALNSTIPWLYWDWKNLSAVREQRMQGQLPGFQARLNKAALVASNCESGRLSEVAKLAAKNVSIDSIGHCELDGVANPGWPMGVDPHDKVGALTRYRVYLAMENDPGFGYVTEKVMDGYNGGNVNLYVGAPNIGDYLPDGTYLNGNIDWSDDGAVDALATQLKLVLDSQTAWESYMTPLEEPMELWSGGRFQQTLGWSKAEPDNKECRMCRLAFGLRHGIAFDQTTQRLEHNPCAQ